MSENELQLIEKLKLEAKIDEKHDWVSVFYLSLSFVSDRII
jgi:hypothetical protein